MKLLICLYDSTKYKNAIEAFQAHKLKQVADVEGYTEMMDFIESIGKTLELNSPSSACIALSSGGDNPMLIEFKDLDIRSQFHTPDQFWALNEVMHNQTQPLMRFTIYQTAKVTRFVEVRACNADAAHALARTFPDGNFTFSLPIVWEDDIAEYIEPEPTPTKTYRVVYSSMTKYSIDVQADTPEEAARIARDTDGAEFEAQGEGDWVESDVYEIEGV